MNIKINTTKNEELGSVNDIFGLVQYDTLGLKYTTLTDNLSKIDHHLTEYNARVELIIQEIGKLGSSKEFNLEPYKEELIDLANQLIWEFNND